jgi:membrane-bound ClpP family serine protease
MVFYCHRPLDIDVESAVSMIWIISLLVLAVALIALELFVPSGGALGVLSALAIIAAVSLAYYHHGAMVGTIVLALNVIVVPLLVYQALRWWPNTPIGRRILIQPPEEEGPDSAVPAGALNLLDLVGRRGVAKSPLLPSGVVEIEGQQFDAVSRGRPVEVGQPIEVVDAPGNHLVVRGLLVANEPPRDQTAGLLDESFDGIDLSTLDEPLA